MFKLFSTLSDIIETVHSNCTTGQVRLVDGVSANEGRIELCYGSVWGSLCYDSSWTRPHANVVCRQLGYHPTGMPPTLYSYGSSLPTNSVKLTNFVMFPFGVQGAVPIRIFSGYRATF